MEVKKKGLTALSIVLLVAAVSACTQTVSFYYFLQFRSTSPNVTEEDMEKVVDQMGRRLDAFGKVKFDIQPQEGKRINVWLPDDTDIELIKNLIGQTALLEFKERTCLVNTANDPCEKEGNYEDEELGLTGDDLARAWPDQHQTTGIPIISIQFNSRGTSIFADFTKRIAGDNMKRVAIILDGEELLAPVVRSPILDGRVFIESSMQNSFTMVEVQRIAIQLNAGCLSVPMTLVAESDCMQCVREYLESERDVP